MAKKKKNFGGKYFYFFWGNFFYFFWGKFFLWRRGGFGPKKNSVAQTCSNMSKHAQTCLNVHKHAKVGVLCGWHTHPYCIGSVKHRPTGSVPVQMKQKQFTRNFPFNFIHFRFHFRFAFDSSFHFRFNILFIYNNNNRKLNLFRKNTIQTTNRFFFQFIERSKQHIVNCPFNEMNLCVYQYDLVCQKKNWP